MRFTSEELYNNADMTKLRDLDALSFCYRRITILQEANELEIEVDEPNYTLIKARNDAIDFWLSIIKEVWKV